MTENEYRKKSNALFKNWKNNDTHEDSCFVEDGIICYSKWTRSNKILIILKEAYSNGSKENEWYYSDLITTNPDWVKNNNMYKMLCIWLYIINNTTKYYKPSKIDSHFIEEGYEILVSSAVINLKKSHGKSTSGTSDIINYAKKDSNYLKKQLELISPSIVLCGYTADILFKHVFSVDDYSPLYKSDYIINYNGTPYIDYWHPARKNGREEEYAMKLAQDYNKFLNS